MGPAEFSARLLGRKQVYLSRYFRQSFRASHASYTMSLQHVDCSL
jgi:hypothetical protein